MLAIRYTDYGDPEVLMVVEVHGHRPRLTASTGVHPTHRIES